MLDFNRLRWNRTTNLEPLRKALADYRTRIRVALPKHSAAHPEILLLASMFHHYRG